MALLLVWGVRAYDTGGVGVLAALAPTHVPCPSACPPACLPAGGLPIGAVLLRQHVADAMAPGDHGSTFAGNPLVCHAACTVFDIISDPGGYRGGGCGKRG